jgi:hypothetical protein
VRKTREDADWAVIDPNREDYINQFNSLEGIENIKPPVRLAVLPYIGNYLGIFQNKKTSIDTRVGADIKWGINESFTLDAALIPDFGQVRSDALVFNLSPYEVRYNEQRPFFTEGAELFSKHNDVFYTRRIGEVSNYFYQKKGIL